MKSARRGFTLIELMIVVAIIGVLAAIAIPNFVRYQLRSKTSEARTNVGGIRTAQTSFQSTEDNYANVTTVTPAAAPSGTIKADWVINACAGCSRLTTPACISFECIGFRPDGNVYYVYVSPHQAAAAGAPAEYAIGARADLDGDGVFGEFLFGSNNVGVNPSVNALTTPLTATGPCAAAGGVTAGEVFDCSPGVY
ncbi:MAG: prepilin-type N-terminal cleavage/methylation domain-containing protein [Myxococcota bacterium]